MRQQITVYLESANLRYLKSYSERTGLPVSGTVNSLVSKMRLNDSEHIGEVNRSLENARVADLENEEV